LLGFVVSTFFVSGCTVEGRLVEILGSAFTTASVIWISDSCHSFLGFGPAVAVFDVTFTGDDPAPDLTALATGDGTWTRQESLQQFAEDHDQENGLGISATVLDGKDCLGRLGRDVLLSERILVPGQYYRSKDQSVVIVMPESTPGQGVLFVQGP
jgi:hypothetical protein